VIGIIYKFYAETVEFALANLNRFSGDMLEVRARASGIVRLLMLWEQDCAIAGLAGLSGAEMACFGCYMHPKICG